MRENPFNQEREEIKTLLKDYHNFKTGKKFNFIEEDAFEKIIDHFEENENLALAMEAVNYATEQFPFSSILLIKKADLLAASQRFLEALAILEKASIFDQSDASIYLLKVDIYLALEEHGKVAEVLDAAMEFFHGQEKTDLLLDFADIFDDYGEFSKVFDCLKIILEQEPDNEEALYKICFWTDITGRDEESVAIHRKILNEYPYSHLAWFNLGAAYQGLKLYEKSIDAYLYAIAIDEQFDLAYRNLGDAYLRLHKYSEAIEALQKALELAIPESVIYEAIGHCYQKLKNPALARANYRKAIQLNDLDSRLYYKIAQTYVLESHWESAIDSLQSALNIHRDKADYHYSIAYCYEATDKIKEAVLHFSQYVKMRPKSKKGWKALIECLYHAEYFEEALFQINLAQNHTRNKPIFLYYKAAVLFAMGKSKEAVLYLQQGLYENPSLVKEMLTFDSSLLKNYTVVELIRESKAYKKK